LKEIGMGSWSPKFGVLSLGFGEKGYKEPIYYRFFQTPQDPP
jgi:hypothetical protein